MKKYFLTTIALSLSVVMAIATGGDKKATTYSVDTKSSNIEWRGDKVTGHHTGTVELQKGTMTAENGKLTGGTFVVNMTSIKNTDIEDAENRGKLEGHLKSDDFFSVSKHKTATFELTDFKEMEIDSDGNNYMVTGELTIKGITNEISFPASIKMEENKITAQADLTFDRSKYNVRYGSGSFFDDLGDNMIYDEVKISLNIVGKV